MKLVEINSFEATAGLRQEWNALLDASGSNSIFQTWDWFQAWWPAYAEPGWRLRLLLIQDDGRLWGLAALREQMQQRRGIAARTLRFAVDGSNDSEYLDVLVNPERAPETRAALAGWLSQELAEGCVLQWNEMPQDSVAAALLRTLAGTTCTERRIPCATTALPDTLETFVAGLKPRFRTKIRSTLRAFEERPEYQFGYCQTAEEAAALLPELFRLHARRWESEGQRGVFHWNRKRDFYLSLSRRLADGGVLRFSWLKFGHEVLACQFGFLRGGTYFHLQEGYEPEAEHCHCGIGLRAWSIRQLIEEGVREYDFLGGVNRHKSDWGAVEKLSLDLEVAAPNSWRSRIYQSAPAWETRFRETARAVLPESVFTLRQKLLSSAGSTAASADVDAPPPTSLLWRAAASVYFHSGVLPAAARPLREKYALVRNGVNGGAKLHLEKRRAPLGRILYYHRVNNDGDPFFPATPTEVFERQVRYLARHHTVVSLAEMIRRLDDGTPGDTVAITFDDGYRDNYEQALPVLERYGLPATIFLTTAPMDSGEPMWFERLAGALRDTADERVDTEIDVPRRWPLRNRRERLFANARIYAQLRQLPDARRLEWLERILGQLGSPPVPDRQGRMLSWDHVRAMSKRRISFGGHTVNHPFLSRLPSEGIVAEAAGCRRRIEEELQQPVPHFAYPSGRAEDFGLENTALIRAAGYEAAVTTIWGLNDASTDRMTLRRGGPWEERMDVFAAKLDWYQLVNG